MGDRASVMESDVSLLDADESADQEDTTTPVRVLIADDAPDARFLLRVWLERHGAMDVVAEATDGVDAVERAGQTRPDLVLLDVSMPRMDGLEAAVEIRRTLPDTKIVMFSAFSAERMGERAILAGADVYLEKKVGPEQIFAAIDDLFGVQALRPVPPNYPAESVESDPHETRLRLLFDVLDEGVIVVDNHARVDATNHSATILLGISTSQMVGRPLKDLFVDAISADGRRFDADCVDPITETLRSGRPRSGVVVGTRRSDGERAWLSVNVRPVGGSAPNEAPGAIASLTDVTAARALRGELAAAAVRTQSILEASAASVLVVRTVRDRNNAVVDHRIVGGNRAAFAGICWHIGTVVGASPVGCGQRELIDRVADALDRADTALGAECGTEAAADGPGVRWVRSGDDEVVLTWDPVGPPP